ncbi:Lrp/AsnC family transcriptional regulator [Clostridium manihotivorum]|uniref:Transcriptional regulator n=1 Tax=Clostridium manihotivorum TaxID=2320868 RepID=A0A410DN25_9CLOT|nr:Lrp/AsnC family transcriptional regulator [Clostridium manihotivorum]QAA30456.1 transcriptional regulator [Clostridium manihotivorum]
MKIDEIDMLILSELELNSRLSTRELSKKVNLSAPSVGERIKKLEGLGIIKGYTIKIDKKKLGYTLDCFILVTMRNGEYDRFKKFIASHNRSGFCYRIAGDHCFIVKLTVRDLSEVESFISEISSYTITSTIIAFSEVEIEEGIKKLLK